MLSELFAEATAQLQASVAGAGALVGREGLADLTQPAPRIVWIPTTFRFEPTANVGGSPRQLFTRVQRVEVHCWGGDIGGAEALMHATVAALQAVAPGAIAPVDGTRRSDTDAETDHLGYVFAFAFEVAIPVLDTITFGTATLAALPITSVIALPSGDRQVTP